MDNDVREWEKIVRPISYPWKYECNAVIGDLTYEWSRGDILDIGCGTCQLYAYLARKNWSGRYCGIDIKRYKDIDYPEGADVLIGDALEMDFPDAETYTLYDILEHTDRPITLLNKAIKTAKVITLISLPLRNEWLWNNLNVSEYHQLDKTHKCVGLVTSEVCKLVEMANGKIIEHTYLRTKLFGRQFNFEIWCAVVKQ